MFTSEPEVITMIKYFMLHSYIGAATCDFQKCGTLTSVDSGEPCSLLLSLGIPNGVQSLV